MPIPYCLLPKLILQNLSFKALAAVPYPRGRVWINAFDIKMIKEIFIFLRFSGNIKVRFSASSKSIRYVCSRQKLELNNKRNINSIYIWVNIKRKSKIKWFAWKYCWHIHLWNQYSWFIDEFRLYNQLRELREPQVEVNALVVQICSSLCDADENFALDQIGNHRRYVCIHLLFM